MVNAESNSTADGGNIEVSPGNRIPLIPLHTGRLRVDYAFGKVVDAGATLIAASGVYLHGDENNANVPGGVDFIGSGHIPGYAVVNLDATWHGTAPARMTGPARTRYPRAHFGASGTDAAPSALQLASRQPMAAHPHTAE